MAGILQTAFSFIFLLNDSGDIWSQGLRHDDVIKWKHFPQYWPFAENSPVTGEFPSQRPVTRSFDIFFDLRLNKRLSKQSRRWWFEALSRSLWRHCNEDCFYYLKVKTRSSNGSERRQVAIVRTKIVRCILEYITDAYTNRTHMSTLECGKRIWFNGKYRNDTPATPNTV